MSELISSGGPLMVPIILGSVVALGVFIERALFLRRRRVVPPGFAERVRALAADGKLDEAAALCRDAASPIGRVLGAALANVGRARAVLKERVEEVGRRETARLERYIGVLGVVASIEPLLGLLGTVTGMIGVFQRVVTDGVGDPSRLAEGIWEALITTAAGLTVAIPAYIGWRYLLARVRDLVLEMEDEAVGLVDELAVEPDRTEDAA